MTTSDHAPARVSADLAGTAQTRGIRHLLEAQAERAPDAVAIAAPGRAPLTYGRLDRQVREVVQALRASGLRRDDRVAMALPDGPEIVVAFLGVADGAISGAISAPLNPHYRASELDWYLTDLDAKALIVQFGTHSPARGVAQAWGIPIIELSAVPEGPAGIFTLSASERAQASRQGFAQPDHVALLLHTSGTTSRPKPCATPWR
jgi:acyl-CoA synthetase (AMP-forming)/AMP-acid ligase II